jgi:hypothetical protein
MLNAQTQDHRWHDSKLYTGRLRNFFKSLHTILN